MALGLALNCQLGGRPSPGRAVGEQSPARKIRASFLSRPTQTSLLPPREAMAFFPHFAQAIPVHAVFMTPVCRAFLLTTRALPILIKQRALPPGPGLPAGFTGWPAVAWRRGPGLSDDPPLSDGKTTNSRRELQQLASRFITGKPALKTVLWGTEALACKYCHVLMFSV